MPAWLRKFWPVDSALIPRIWPLPSTIDFAERQDYERVAVMEKVILENTRFWLEVGVLSLILSVAWVVF
jgi:hypothetical protein